MKVGDSQTDAKKRSITGQEKPRKRRRELGDPWGGTVRDSRSHALLLRQDRGRGRAGAA